MIVLDCEQGSREWIEARLGIPTASEFKRIVTATGKLSTSRHDYLDILLYEYCYGEPKDEFGGNEWVDYGKSMEPQAFEYYSFIHDIEPEKVGFVYRDDDRMAGCSPDALVGDEGGLEFKCPAPWTHIRYCREGIVPKEYYCQVQGCLWVTGRKWWDFVSYCPDFKQQAFIVRATPDEAYQDALNEYMPKFIKEVRKGRAWLDEQGAAQ